MTTITFDTLELVDKLKAAGITSEQAEAVVPVIAVAQDELVTKTYLDIELSPFLTDLAVLKWMISLILSCVLSLVLKAFF